MEHQKMNSPAAPQLDGSLDELSKIVEETNRFEHKARITSVVLYLAILVVVFIFGVRFYGTIKANFTKEKFVASLELRAKELAPQVKDNLIFIWEKCQPVYVEEAKKTLVATLPQLQAMSEQELTKMVDLAKEHLAVIMKDVMKTKENVLQSIYINLTPPDIDVASIANEKVWVDEIAETTRLVIEPFQRDWQTLRGTINKFDNPSLPNDENALYRQMAHYMLLLLDKEITEVK